MMKQKDKVLYVVQTVTDFAFDLSFYLSRMCDVVVKCKVDLKSPYIYIELFLGMHRAKF